MSSPKGLLILSKNPVVRQAATGFFDKMKGGVSLF